MILNDTIAAFATSSASGAVALLRLSGPLSFAILQSLTNKKNFEPRKATLVNIYDEDTILDKALALYFKAPASYTGQDIVEITLHASPYIKTRVLQNCFKLGARMAKPGEFTMRAYLNGKMDLAQAQGVADIIASKNKAAHKAAMNTLEGKLSSRLQEIKTDLMDLLAQVEVRLDDTDGEMQDLPKEYIEQILSKAQNNITKLAQTFSNGKFVKEGIKTAIIGVPNSGKSSLLNALLGFDRAIVSEQSGTTRDTLEAEISIDGFNLILTDTAGIREHALDAAEIEGMLRSHKAAAQADIIIFVRAPQKTELEENLFKQMQQTGKKIIEVHNKEDLFKGEVKKNAISCKTGQGLEDLKKEIIKTIGLADLNQDEVIITSALHYQALKKASEELNFALEKSAELDLMAAHLRWALESLQGLIGIFTPEDVLDIIFSKFCVGK